MRHEQPEESEGNGLPKGFFVEQSTGRRLQELCHEMTNSCGMIKPILQLALEAENEGKRTAFIKTALDASARGTKSLKLFLSEWGVLIGESNRDGVVAGPGNSAT